MDLLVTLFVGLIAGTLAGMIMKGGYGILGDLIVGVVGAFVGSWIFEQFSLSIGGGIIGAIIVAMIGAVVLIAVLRIIKRA